MKRLCLPALARRSGALALLAGATGLSAATGCATSTTGNSGGDSSTSDTSSSTGSTTASSSSSGGGAGGHGGATTSSAGGTGGAGGAGGATSSSASASSTSSGIGTVDYPGETEQNNLKATANPLQPGTKGFTASLASIGDVDVFSAEVTLAGTQLQASISDGLGGCPAGAATYLRLYDPNGALVAADKDSGPASCSLLAPATTPALQGLAPGKYFLQVDNLTATPLPLYVLDIALTAPTCGDGLVQLGGEQCDDGNTTAGDGCSATCQLEGVNGYVGETEPNDTLATADSLAGKDGAIASVGTLTDVDYFSFTVATSGSAVALTVDNGLGVCPPGFDSKIFLYDSGNVQIASDDDNGPQSCSAILPAMYPAAAGLAAGTYTVKVQSTANSSVVPYYVLGVKITPPVCGDGVLQLGEQCDDHNVTSGDGCSPTCAFEGNFTPETEPNDTQPTSNPLGSADGFLAAVSPIGDLDHFDFNVVTPGSSVFIQVTDGLNGCPAGFDSKLTLFNPSNALLATADDGGTAKCSLLSPATVPASANMAVGKYRVRVEYNGNTVAIPSYVLKIKVVPPSCGDGVLQPGEQCDDSNTAANDGCSPTCQSDPGYEIEPNGTLAKATPPWPGITYWRGAISPLADHDYYSFVLTATSTVTLTTHSVNNPAACPGDTLLHLANGMGADLLANDDDPANAPCSTLTKAALPPGTYYAWVQRYQDSVLIPAYQLDLKVQ